MFSSAQNGKCKKILITHSYEDLYISYIAPLDTCDKQKHGPITIADSSTINKITLLLKDSKESCKTQKPDVRFKLEFIFENKKETLCFGQSKESMFYSNKLYKYNSTLCSYIIELIEKSGAKKPRHVLPPTTNNNEE